MRESEPIDYGWGVIAFLIVTGFIAVGLYALIWGA